MSNALQTELHALTSLNRLICKHSANRTDAPPTFHRIAAMCTHTRRARSTGSSTDRSQIRHVISDVPNRKLRSQNQNGTVKSKINKLKKKIWDRINTNVNVCCVSSIRILYGEAMYLVVSATTCVSSRMVWWACVERRRSVTHTQYTDTITFVIQWNERYLPCAQLVRVRTDSP